MTLLEGIEVVGNNWRVTRESLRRGTRENEKAEEVRENEGGSGQRRKQLTKKLEKVGEVEG